MPAAAVIPAPIAYIKVVAVKTLVVEILLCKTEYPFGLSLVSDCICLIHAELTVVCSEALL